MAEMTSRDRVLAALSLKEPDRVPVGSFATHVAGKIVGINVHDYSNDAEKMAVGQRALGEKGGFDILFPFHSVGVYAQGWGSKIRYVDADVSPPISDYRVKKADDWKEVKPFEAEKVPGVKVCIDAIKRLKDWLGDRAFVLGVIFSPITSATHVCDLGDVLKHVKKSPDLLTAGLGPITESLITMVHAFEKAGADGIYLALTRATAEILTEQQYKTIAGKWDEMLLNEIHVPVISHICGRNPMLELAADYPNMTGLNWWDRGTQISLKDAKAKFGGRQCLVAGIDQTRTIMTGTPHDVEAEAKDAIEQAGKGGGFILFSGCDLPIKTPLENIQAMSLAAKKYGTYPL